jgi:hypothetical protein
MPDSSDNEPNPLMVFVILSIVFVGILLVGFILLFAVSRLTGSDSSSQGTMPYGIVARPIPAGGTVAELLPEKLGDFKRGPISGDIQSFSATYTGGSNKIDFAGSRGVSLRAAQASVANIDRANNSKNNQHQLNQDPSFVLIPGAGQVRLVWSHDRWLFDVTASSQAALDAFMSAFKY